MWKALAVLPAEGKNTTLMVFDAPDHRVQRWHIGRLGWTSAVAPMITMIYRKLAGRVYFTGVSGDSVGLGLVVGVRLGQR